MEAGSSVPSPSVNGFVLQEKLGSGSYATVYRAYAKAYDSSQMTRETVAIKCMQRSLFQKYRAASDNLVLEIGILKKLRHRHIVQMRDFQWDGCYIYLIMEFCAGGDLSKFLARNSRLDERITRRFLQQLASALNYLRSKDICHLDLKPKNILIDNRAPPYCLKLADFGFATFLADDEITSSKRGSPLYMAPEMLSRSSYDARVDLWSLGVILYECLFGRPPFIASSIEEIELLVCSTEPIEFPSEPLLSVPCFDLLSWLLIRDPNHRISYPDFFEHPFVDLEHAPSEESMATGIQIAKQAVVADRKGDVPTAINLYCKSVEYFLPHLSVIVSADAKASLRHKILTYVRRAEALKATLRPRLSEEGDSRPGSSSTRVLGFDQISKSLSMSPRSSAPFTGVDSTGPSSLVLESAPKRANKSSERQAELAEMWADRPEVKAALTVADVAADFLSRGEYQKALDKYILAIDSMLHLLNQQQPPTQGQGRNENSLKTVPHSLQARLDLLRAQIATWTRVAERIKEYLKTENVTAVMDDLANEDFVVEQHQSTAKDGQCRTQ